MTVPAPHFVLFSTARPDEAEAGSSLSRRRGGHSSRCGGRWSFVLEAADGSERLEVAGTEPGVSGQRLELLSVIRGLEALDQPSRVTLVTSSDHVCRGLRFGLPEWRDNGWQWEFFGRMVPVRDADLWQRLDRAVRIHDVHCRVWRRDEAQKPGRPHRRLRPAGRRRTADRGASVRQGGAILLGWFRRLWAERTSWLRSGRRTSPVCAG